MKKRRSWQVVSPSRSRSSLSLTLVGSFDSTVRLWDLRYVLSVQKSYLVSVGLTALPSAMNRQAIQVLDEARDAVQTLHVGSTYLLTGSVDGHVRTYDLRMGELRSDFIGREQLPYVTFAAFNVIHLPQTPLDQSFQRKIRKPISSPHLTATSGSWTVQLGRS